MSRAAKGSQTRHGLASPPDRLPPRQADTGAKKGASDGAPGPVDKAAPVPPPAPPSTSAPAEQSDGTEEQQPSKVVALDAFRKKN